MQALAKGYTGTNRELSASEREKAKTPLEKGRDVAYTINHAIMCLSSDAIDPHIGNYAQKKLGKDFSLRGAINLITRGEAEKQIGDGSSGNIVGWWIGEAIGDAGAVPVTIMMQRCFPGFMSGIQSALEPPLKGVFTRAAHKQAIAWGEKHGLDAIDPKVQQKEKELYQYEVNHLPQAFMWTASAIAINLAVQKLAVNKEASLPVLLVGKGLGTVTTAATLITARGFFPDQMHKADSWVSKNIVNPVAQKIGAVFGLDHETMKTPMEDTPATASVGGWQKRMTSHVANENASTMLEKANDNSAPLAMVQTPVEMQGHVQKAATAKSVG